jgi:hypothetical protein
MHISYICINTHTYLFIFCRVIYMVQYFLTLCILTIGLPYNQNHLTNKIL